MIPNTRADRLHETPYVPYVPETHDTPEQIAVCEHCPLPDCDDMSPLCQFQDPEYIAAKSAALERGIAYLCHLLVMKPVYRAVEKIRRELG